MRNPRIHLAPEAAGARLADSIRSGGGELSRVEEAEALVWADGRHPDALGALLRQHPQIRWVQLPWAGVEPYARAALFDRDRLWTSGKGVCAGPVAEHALALALAGLRNVHTYAEARSWGRQAGTSLAGSRVTIFGGGGVARELVRLLQPFGCRITVVRLRPEPLEGVDRVVGFSERHEAIRGADVVFLALALTAQTTALLGRAEFEMMERHAWLVNVARGEHVVTDDLVAALQAGTIGGAALDVTDPEPLPDEHPLWSIPNCLITPHTANTEAMEQPLLSARIAENVRRFAQGQDLLGRIDPDLGY